MWNTQEGQVHKTSFSIPYFDGGLYFGCGIWHNFGPEYDTVLRPISEKRPCIVKALSQGLPVLQHYGGASTVYQKLEKWLSDSCPWLKLWNFSEELPYRKTNCLQGFQTCLQMLEETEKEVAITTTDVEDFLVTKLNSNPTLDLHLMEAVKLLMLVSAIELYPRYQSQENLPVFIWLLFARETSRTPKDLMLNHLNALKQTKHIREVELYLLGYSLFVTLKVFQLLHYGGDNFVTHYPEWNIGTWPEILLIAENDLCYNTIVR
ncbi:inactive ubiquitin thioesterase OTULINL-like [Tachypleus tridentatus]|uniref:inactive ubiquitin thioesterase OTULINL-like n=1 Tax=Tachypleus tridentatus TaxID=6853 RepID=UPI003FD40792